PAEEQVTQPTPAAESNPTQSAPRVITVDKNAAYPKAMAELKAAGILPETVELRQVKYLRDFREVNRPRYGILRQEKLSWRDENGTDRGSQRTACEDGQGTQRQCPPHVYGAHGSNPGRRGPAAGRTRVGLESPDHPQRDAGGGTRSRLHRRLPLAWSQAQ